MSSRVPQVSIGMAVYNGEKYLRQALNSLLKQDFTDFELIISDNASTDATEQICREYAHLDSRIRYYRNKENIGSAKNLNQVFGMASGQYFMWVAHDDLWSNNYVSECLKGLEANPEAVMCCAKLEFIDRDGEHIEFKYDSDNNFDSRGLRLKERVRLLLSRTGWFSMYGLMRVDALKQTNLFYSAWGTDVILLLELSILGEFVKVPSTTFFYRMLNKDVIQVMGEIDPASSKANLDTPFTTLLVSLLKDCRRVIKAKYQRISIQFEILYTCLYRNHVFRQFVRRENLAKLNHAYKTKDLLSILYASVVQLLFLPEAISFLKNRNSNNLLTAYRQQQFTKAILQLPIFVLLNFSSLFRLESWRALGNLGKKSFRKNSF